MRKGIWLSFYLLLLLLFSAAEAGAAITATVIDDDGKPIAGATVQAFARETRQAAVARVLAGKPDAPPVASAQSGADGAVRLDVARTPVVMLLVTAPGRSMVMEAADGDDLGTLLLPASSTYKGRVTAGGKPVAGALIALGNRILGRTGADGTYEVPESALAARLLIVHPDFAPSDTSADWRGGAPSLDRQLTAGVPLRGVVLGADGKPAAHAELSIGGHALAESGEDGSFTIARAPADWKTIVARTATQAGVAKRSAAASYEIRLRPAALLNGTVRDPKQAGVAGMRITLASDVDSQQAVTDAKGNFSLPALPAGRYEVSMTHPAFYYQAGTPPLQLSEGRRETRALAVEPYARVRGTVVNDERKPVAAAVVTSMTMVQDAPRFAATNAAGEFTIRMAETNAPSMLTASRKGYASASARVAVTAGETKSGVTLTLRRGIPVRVVVIDTDRVPVANVAVLFARWNDESGTDTSMALPCDRPRCNLTGEDGALDVRLAEGKYDIMANGEGVVAKRQIGETITARSSPLTITMERGVEISGRVVYSDGTGVPGVFVRIINQRSFAGGSARTDDGGAFVIRSSPRGRQTLAVETMNRTTSMQKEVDAPASGVVLTLPKPGQISGRVSDAGTKAPVKTFSVSAVRRGGGGPPTPPTPVQSEDGSFTIDAPTGAVDVQVTAPGYARGTATGIDVEEGKTVSGVEVHLERGARVVGKVTANGAAVSGVAVTVGRNTGTPMFMMGPMDRQGSVTSDANGEYALDSVAAGDQVIVFTKSGYVQTRKSVEVAAGKESRLDVELSRGFAVSGRVVDEMGTAVGQAQVRAMTAGSTGVMPSTSDAEGMFRVEGLPEPRVTLIAHKVGYLEARVENADTASSVTLTLHRGGTITGRILGVRAEDLPLVRVSGYAAGGGGGVQGRVESDGRFVLQGVPEGRISVSAIQQTSPMRQSASKIVDVVNGSAPSVDIDFGGFTVRGHVRRGGRPVENASVVFQPTDSTKQSPAYAQTRNAAGEYVAAGLSGGEYRVVVSLPGGGSASSEQLTVSGDLVHDIEIRSGTIRGRVVDARSGAPVSDALVAADGGSRPVTSDSEGKFVIDVGNDGNYRVRTQKDRYAPATEDVVVAGGAAPDVELRITPVDATVIRVVDAYDGHGVDATVTVLDSARRTVFTGQSVAGEEGAVRLYVAPGAYTVDANSRGLASARANITVPTAGDVQIALTRGGTVIAESRSGASVRGRLVPSDPSRRTIAIFNMAPNVPAGDYTLEVLGNDGKPTARYPVTVVEGQTVAVPVE